MKVDGQISSGDHVRLHEVLSAFNGFEDGFWDSGIVLSLDSPGGNYTEGLRMGSLIREKGVGTRVVEGAACYSACAIIFMHGSISADGETYLNRRLHSGARLGFHAPYLVLPDDVPLSPELIAASYATALHHVSMLIESTRTIFSEELLMKMLRVPPDDMLMVRNYGDLLTWDIALIDAEKTELQSLTQAQLLMACENFDDIQNNRRPDIKLEEAQDYVERGHGPRLLGTNRAGDAIYSYSLNDMDGIGCNVGIGRTTDRSLHARYYGDAYARDSEGSPLPESYSFQFDGRYFKDPSEPFGGAGSMKLILGETSPGFADDESGLLERQSLVSVRRMKPRESKIAATVQQDVAVKKRMVGPALNPLALLFCAIGIKPHKLRSPSP